MKKILMAGLAAVAISGFSGPASAEVAPITAGLSGTVTADNAFELFVSTDPNSLGTLVASGSDWQSPVDVSIPLDGAYKYYINIIADNFDGPATPDNGNPDALLGQLSVSGNYQFAGGGQTLLTGSTGWTADSESQRRTARCHMAVGQFLSSFAAFLDRPDRCAGGVLVERREQYLDER